MSYPEYTYPDYVLDEPSDDELKRIANKLVDLEYGRYALGPIKRGQRILIVAPYHQDPRVLEALRTVMLDRGAAVVDVVSEKDVLGWKTIPNWSSDRPWDEFAFFTAHFEYRKFMEDSDAPPKMQANNYANLSSLKEYLQKLPKQYDTMFAGPGGWSHYKQVVGGPFKSLWPYTNYEYLRLFADFPQQVWSTIEDRIKSIMPQVEEVKVTDAEGTDLRFTMSEDEAKLWREESQPSNHLFMYPRPPSFPESNGVIAGTSNHFGFFPYTKVHIKHGMVVKIEGGGKFGDMWRMYADRYRDTQYPDFPSPGYYYIHESALATNPRGFRHPKEVFNTPIFMTNDSERNRAGVLHWGFGLLFALTRRLMVRQEHSQDKYILGMTRMRLARVIL